MDGEKQIDETLAAMNALPAATDVNAAMTTFNDKVKESEDMAAKAKEKSADMRARAGVRQSVGKRHEQGE